MIRQVAIAMLAVATWGCTSTFHETHYFKSGGSAPAVPNYYRLTVEGYSLISSSRYLSGYFDEDTINTYFNEYTQPAGAAIVSTSKNKSPGTSGSGGAVEPVARGLQGQKLVMILSEGVHS